MPSRFLALSNSPECWDEWPPSLVDPDRVQSNVDVIAEVGVVKSQKQKSNVAREWCESEARGDAVGPNRVPDSHAPDGTIPMDLITGGERMKVFENFPIG